MAQQSHPYRGPQRNAHGALLFHMDSSLFLELGIPYKWWEDEATTIFWANSVHDMRRLLRFQLYSNDDLPRSTLLGRSAGTVKIFLRHLLHPNEQVYIDHLSHQETVEQIVLLCQQNRPSQSRWSWSPSTLQTDGAHAIAVAIGEESYRQFQSISFEDWVHFALGYPTQSVEWFVAQPRELYRLLSTYLYSSPHDTDKFAEIEKVCPCSLVGFSFLWPCLRLKLASVSAASLSFRPSDNAGMLEGSSYRRARRPFIWGVACKFSGKAYSEFVQVTNQQSILVAQKAVDISNSIRADLPPIWEQHRLECAFGDEFPLSG